VPMEEQLRWAISSTSIWRSGTQRWWWSTATPTPVPHPAAPTRVALEQLFSCRHAAVALSKPWTSSPPRALASRTSAAAPSPPPAPHPPTKQTYILNRSLNYLV
jgi:hypothetical protein